MIHPVVGIVIVVVLIVGGFKVGEALGDVVVPPKKKEGDK